MKKILVLSVLTIICLVSCVQRCRYEAGQKTQEAELFSSNFSIYDLGPASVVDNDEGARWSILVNGVSGGNSITTSATLVFNVDSVNTPLFPHAQVRFGTKAYTQYFDIPDTVNGSIRFNLSTDYDGDDYLDDCEEEVNFIVYLPIDSSYIDTTQISNGIPSYLEAVLQNGMMQIKYHESR